MICPQCQKELPEGQNGKPCPFCGASAIRPNWRIFLCALLVPPILTLISAFPAITRMTGNISPIVGVLGSLVGAIVCGGMIGGGGTNSGPARVIVSFIFTGIMFVVCLMLCFFGCAVGSGGI
jgi:hypothetical protein